MSDLTKFQQSVKWGIAWSTNEILVDAVIHNWYYHDSRKMRRTAFSRQLMTLWLALPLKADSGLHNELDRFTKMTNRLNSTHNDYKAGVFEEKDWNITLEIFKKDVETITNDIFDKCIEVD